MESGMVPAIISFLLPGIGQAATVDKTTYKWVIVFTVYAILTSLIITFISTPIGYIFSIIVRITLAYDAYMDKIDIDSIF